MRLRAGGSKEILVLFYLSGRSFLSETLQHPSVDWWRVFLGRSEIGREARRHRMGVALADWIKVEVQCHLWLWNSSQSCFPSPSLLGSSLHPLAPTPCGDWTSECSKESSLVACTFSSAVINWRRYQFLVPILWFIHRHFPYPGLEMALTPDAVPLQFAL